MTTAPLEPYDDCLLEELEAARALVGGRAGMAWTDAHTHTGSSDPDGVTATAPELLRGMDRGGIGRALVFTTAEPDGYPPANDRVLEEVEASGGRLVALGRIDPNAGDPLPEARRCLAAGAAGFKLHPRSDAFTMSHPAVAALVELADEEGAIVLVHAGRGIPALGADLVRLAARHRDARFILAHAGISDLGLVADATHELENLFFDTSWWNVADLLTLYTTVAPSRILFASDMPYGSGRFAALAMLRCAGEAGLGPDAIAAIAGATVEHLIAGEPVPDLGDAPGRDALGPRRVAFERITTYTAAVVQIAYPGGDPTEPLALARLACQVPAGTTRFEPEEARLLGRIDALLAGVQDALAAEPGEARRHVLGALAAHLLAGTPRVLA